MQQWWLTVLGAALALLGGIATKLVTDRFIEAPGLRAAIAAEIRAVLGLIQRDNVVGAIDEQIQAMENSQETIAFRFSWRFEALITSFSLLTLPNLICCLGSKVLSTESWSPIW
jgi:hypothetical protein